MRAFARRRALSRARLKKILMWAIGGAVALALALGTYFLPPKSLLNRRFPPLREGEARVHFMDVGQGDCSIVECYGGDLLIIDAGDGGFQAECALFATINGLHPKRLSLLLTHADHDHYGGFTELLSRYEFDKIYLPVLSSSSAFYQKFLAAVKAEGCETEVFSRYHTIAHESGAYLACISHYSAEEGDENDSSAVAFFSFGGVNVLFAGDITAARERLLLREYALETGIVDAGGDRVRVEATDL